MLLLAGCSPQPRAIELAPLPLPVGRVFDASESTIHKSNKRWQKKNCHFRMDDKRRSAWQFPPNAKIKT
jgi:hypothetical protein